MRKIGSAIVSPLPMMNRDCQELPIFSYDGEVGQRLCEEKTAKSSNPRSQGQGVTIWLGKRMRIWFLASHLPKTQPVSVEFLSARNASVSVVSDHRIRLADGN